jgi:chromosomal replication initiator protein
MQHTFDFPITPRYRFDNFVVCGGNQTAYQFAALLAKGGGTDSLLYIHGPGGSGKTHLLMALAERLGERAGVGLLPVVAFAEGERFIPRAAVGDSVSDLFEPFRTLPALLVDDLHLMQDDERLRVALWQLFNDFYTTNRPIVMTGLYPPKELPGLDGHLVSRLLWGLVAPLDISDDDSRRMIMKKLASDRQIILPADAIDYLLVHVPRDIPSLRSALDIVNKYALSTGRRVTARLAREALAVFP